MKRHLLSLGIFVTVVCAAFTLTDNLTVGQSSVVTFTKDVAPILYKSCTECHRPTGVAPMSLLSYKEVRPWAKSIKERAVDRSMPPWFADPQHGEFANNPSLSPAEVNTIVAWADAGAPKGEDKDLNPRVKLFENRKGGSKRAKQG